MTISSTLTAKQYTSTGVSVQFAYPNKIFAASDLVVTIFDLVGTAYPFANFANATLGLTFSVQNVDVDTGCTVVLSAPFTLNWTIDIRTVTAQTQSTSIKNQGLFLPELHEEAFDRATRQIQDLMRLAYTYGIHGPDTETTAWPALGGVSARKGKALMFDATTGLPALGVPNTQTITTGLLAPFLNLQQSAAESSLGITPTNLQYPADPYVDPRRYGADPTGVADSTVAVQTAINVAYRAKGTVWIGNQCTFKCGALSLTFTGNHGTDGLRILGSSVNGSVLQVNGTPATFITFTGNTPTGNPQESPLLIENLTISGTTASDGLLIQGMGLWTLRRVYILGFNRNLFLNSALTGLIDDCLFYQGNYGIFARQDGAGSGNNLVKIRDSAISINARWGIDFGAGDRIKIESCDMEANGTATAIQFTANVAGGATSGTLTSAFLLPTAQYPVKFNNNDVRFVTLTNGATTATWVTPNTSLSTPNATALTGAIVFRSTLSFAAAVATVDLDGMWFENNAGMTLAQEPVTGLTFAIRNTVWYADFSGNSMFLAGGSQFSISDCSSATPGATWIISGYAYSRLANVGSSTIADTSTYPTWIGVTTAAGNFPSGRPDAFTGTLTDCTTAPTLSVTVLQQGIEITLKFVGSLTALGTASTACTVTGLPAKYQPATTQNFPGMGVDNSAAKVMPIQVNPASGTIVLNNTFTASATKGIPVGTVWKYPVIT